MCSSCAERVRRADGWRRAELVRRGEESTEMGGYFICNGIERIIRMLILQRRHYIMALKRSAYLKRGSNYTDAATMIRCTEVPLNPRWAVLGSGF